MVLDKNYCKNQFLEAYTKYIMPHYEGAGELLSWLESTDFFTAPCSTKYHLSIECGLVAHSLNVFTRLIKEFANDGVDVNSIIHQIAFVSLLHDVCKADTYMKTIKNQKIDGEWRPVETYEFSEKFTYGHGTKSVYLIQKFIKNMTDEEAEAIRYHMGGYEYSGYLEPGTQNVYPRNKLALLLHLADMKATYIDESIVKLGG